MADDHVLLRNALASLIDSFANCKVILQCSNGQELMEAIQTGARPDIILLDLNMPQKDGFETANWLQLHAPEIHVLMLTMYDTEISLIRLLKSGVKGFLKKDIYPDELRHALESVMATGYYYAGHATGKLMNLFRQDQEGGSILQTAMLSDPEVEFLKLACTDLTYKEIAMQMQLNPRTIDTLRDQLFVKLDVKSRVGLAMVAIKHGLTTF